MNEEAKNKSWFSNKLPHLKYYDLVKPVYSYEQKPRKLEGIELTLEGRRELRRGGSGIVQSTLFSPLANDQEVISSKNEIDVKDVLEVIRKLKETNPDFEVTFNLDVKLKQV
ncbi:MAG TPA: hypothetical protein VJG66_02105 [Patescibacteria group bacterium]|nr:hypothetical protein [Patescibacteria group bacterium]